ncbi:ankyrin repeat-containing protein [Heterostelium album PN500]|uniref:Ankyrin repeat-containing protein n=1 Tax=Heterostelium pallidum (strain ATCC 26659 / Pp 5 / PN500) TaxID=670386 RepID=D3BKT3_HETP5|nr:ankyrin repeat-containing protein [Heterostelium album PN500]EFA78513.1 ankyrin repeat-containing protein [Heterostelium album PN500]|eukprot:XP_020430637.1 ankyrin repeat-containing protein [Heterostelium album PN500]
MSVVKHHLTHLVENGSDCNLGGATGNSLDAARKTGQSDLFFFLSGFSKSLDPFDYNEYEDEVEIESNSIVNNYLNNNNNNNNSDSNNNNNNNVDRDNSMSMSSLDIECIKQLQNDKLEQKLKEKNDKLKINHQNFYPHMFVLIDFRGPTWCSLCGYFLWGLRRQGFACEVCGYCVHPKCKKRATLTESCDVARQMNNKDHANSDTVDQFLSTSKHHNDKPLHKQSINRKRLESLYNQFNTLDKEQHGSFDSNHDGKMDLKDFLHGVSVLQNSSQEEQIFFAFQMLDRNNRGYITVGELKQVLQSIYQSLGNLKINSIKPDTLIQYIFPPSIVYKELKEEIKKPSPPFSKALKYGKLVKSLSVDSKIGVHRTDDNNNNNNNNNNNDNNNNNECNNDSNNNENNNNECNSNSNSKSDNSTATSAMSFVQLKDDNHSNNSTPYSSMGSISESPIDTNIASSVMSSSLPSQSSSIEIAKIEREIAAAATTDDIEHSTSDQSCGRLRSSCIRTMLNKPLVTSQSLPTNTEIYINSLNNSINNSQYTNINNTLLTKVLPDTNNNNNNNNSNNNNDNIKKEKKYSTEINMEGRIYYEDYRDSMMKHCNFVQSLGLVELDDNTKEQHTQVSKWMSFEGKEITLGHENWETMQYIMIGIRRAIGETMTLTNRSLKQKDYDVVVEFKYNGWLFKDFSPFPFKKIRDKLDIDPMHFMFSLGPEKIFGNLLLGNLSHVCEVVTSGRSGSMFFRSNEGRYLLKTIPPNEEFVLKSILPSYVQHILKYPNSLISKTLGCYNMTTKNRDLRFIVMNNLFFTPLPIHEKYDLKGSTIGRHVELQEGENEGMIADVSLKDLDFKRTLNIGPEFKAPLMEQIEHDTKLLESHNICDYSLLVGVHRVDEYSPIALASDDILSKDIFDILDEGFFKKKSATSLFQQHYGGILSSDKKEVYFIAIIDTLTTWNYKKKYENMFKSLVHDSSQLSAIDPSSYRARFQRLVQQIVQ